MTEFSLLTEAVESLLRQRRFNDAQAILLEAQAFKDGLDQQRVLAEAMSKAMPPPPRRGVHGLLVEQARRP